MAEGKRLECPAAELLLSSGDKVYSEVCDIGEEEMVGEEGFLKLLKILNDRFGEDQGRDNYDKLLDFFEIKRKQGENMRDFVGMFGMVERECKRVSGNEMPEEMRCYHLLKTAGITQQQRQMTLAYCDKGAWKFRDFSVALINLYGEDMKMKEINQRSGLGGGRERKEKRLTWGIEERE